MSWDEVGQRTRPGRDEPRPGSRTLLLAVMFRVALGRLFGMVAGMKVVPVRDVRMMRRFLVRPRLMVLRRLLVMAGGVLKMFGSLLVMFRSLLGHTSAGIGPRSLRAPVRSALRVTVTSFRTLRCLVRSSGGNRRLQ